MGRPTGALSRNHAARRAEILQLLAQRLSRHDAMHASFRDLVEASGVSVSTLQHYFGKRADIVAAVLETAHRNAAPHLAHMSEAPVGFQNSIEAALSHIRLGFEHFGVGDLHVLGLAEGLRHSSIGPTVLSELLEPSLNAIAVRLQHHQERGEMRVDSDPHFAALTLLAPALLLLLHQHDLGGARTHPKNVDAFFIQHCNSFVRAHATDTTEKGGGSGSGLCGPSADGP